MAERLITVPRAALSGLQDNYRCAGCWNPLSVRFTNEISDDECLIDCGTPGCDQPYLVTTHYVERRLSASQSEFYEARNVLRECALCGWLTVKREPVEKLLSDLGF